MQVIHERCAGLDVHKKSECLCVEVGGGRQEGARASGAKAILAPDFRISAQPGYQGRRPWLV